MKKRDKWVSVLRFGALFAALLAISAAWIVIDDLFSPLGERSVSVEIPNFCGERAETLSIADWMNAKIEYRYDENTPSGVVLAQTPPANSRRKLSEKNPICRVTLTVSLGNETVTVPDVGGMDARLAQSRLREVGLRVKCVKRHGGYPEDTVIETLPRANAVVPVGTEVVLTVSMGTPTPVATVPDLMGLSRSEAIAKAWLSGLSVGEISEVDSDEPAGCVVGQNPVPGTRVSAATKLTLYVSRERQKSDFFWKGVTE